MREELSVAINQPNVTDVRVLGAIGVIELKKGVNVPVAQKFFVERGVWVRPFGKFLYIMPPYIIEPHELSRLTSAMVEWTKQ